MKPRYLLILTLFFILLFDNASLGISYDSHWARESIEEAFQNNILLMTEELFLPDQEATTIDVARGIVFLLDIDGNFSDEGCIQLAKENGFLLNKNLENECMTREEMAIIVNEVLGFDIDTEMTTTFEDDEEISHWTKSGIAKLQEKNIFIGYPDHTFKPKNNITKAELVTVISRCKSFLQQEITISKEKDVSKLAIGFLKYENESVVISPIVGSITLKSGESVGLAVTLPDDSDEDSLQYEINNSELVQIDEETLILEALNVGKTTIRFYLANGLEEATFDVMITE